MQPPTIEQLRDIATHYDLNITDADLIMFRGLMETSLESYRQLGQMAEPVLPVRYPRTSGYRPSPEENPFNAWYWRCSIRGASTGLLSGKRVAIKDNVCVAGVPMMNGSAILEGFVPEFDATIVTRILDAGGEITGKAVCESLCVSGGSVTSDTGPVCNPHDLTRSAGGSSSGSAALVVAGECEMAIGGDQGGSIRIPSAWCGAYGLKPTYGLVPYTGVFPMELTLDHIGPIAGTVADLALLLEAIAGPDGLDPRQHDVQVAAYSKALTSGIRDLRIGIVDEGFNWPGLSEPDVDEAVRLAGWRFTELGAKVTAISVPWHRKGVHVFTPISVEGITALMMRGNGMGTNWKGHYSVSLLDAFARGRTAYKDDLPDTVKLHVLLGGYMQVRYHGRYYAKAQNLARVLTKAYDEALESVDLLVMPTAPLKATPIPSPKAPREERVRRTMGMIHNTCPFDVTGHPAISVPCALSNGLPIGMMLIGRRWDEAAILRVAQAFEHTGAYTVNSFRASVQ